ncbi:MAG: outer membrane beta-barrel protein [Bacteroidota bacterium]
MKLKRTIIYVIISLITGFVLTSEVYSQRIKGTIIAGGSLTQVEGDELKGWSQFGFTGGVGAIVPFGDKWGVNLETTFSQKGSFQKQQFSDSLTDEYRLRLNYLEVPLYVSYTDKDVMSFGLGGYWGRLLNAREEEHSGNQTPYIDSVQFNTDDIGFLVDFRVRVWQRLHLNIRYSQTVFNNIRERYYVPSDPNQQPFTRKQYNQVISIRAVYIFNEARRDVAPE